MPEENRTATPRAEASRFDRLSRYTAHLLIIALAALVAVFGGWQRSLNVDTILPEATPTPGSVAVSAATVEVGRAIGHGDGAFWQAPIETAQRVVQQAFRPTSISMRPNLFVSLRDPGADTPVAPMPAEVKAQQRTTVITHTVAEGETALGIADAYGISVDTLRWTNQLDDPDHLQVGQELAILPVSGVYHTVSDGDTLVDLAARYQVEPGTVAEYNGLANADQLALGARLVFPGGRMPDPPRARLSSRGGTRPGVVAAGGQGQAVAPPAGGLGLANAALKYLGSPYVWAGTGPRGFDCSGFVYYVLRQQGVSIARDVWGQIQYGSRVSRENLQPGDLVFFENTYTAGLSHVGIYIGGGRFINAQDESAGVTIANMNAPYWAARYYGARRVQ